MQRQRYLTLTHMGPIRFHKNVCEPSLFVDKEIFDAALLFAEQVTTLVNEHRHANLGAQGLAGQCAKFGGLPVATHQPSKKKDSVETNCQEPISCAVRHEKLG